MPDVIGLRFRNYTENPRVSSEYARSFSRELELHAPLDADAKERHALEVVARIGDEVEAVLHLRERASPERIRDLLDEHTHAWGGLERMLGGMSRVPTSHGDRGPRAEILHVLLFPSGLSFVAREAKIAWTHGVRRLEAIEREGRRQELEQLAGTDMVAWVEESTRALGEALGLGTKPQEMLSPTALREKNAAFSRALGFYFRLLAAKVDEDDSASVERFRRAVAPLDAYRAAHPVVRGEDDEEIDEEPSEDTEVVPAEPAPVQ